MKLKIEANGVYRPLWYTKKRYVISMGGRGGARSFEASQKIVSLLKQTKRLFRAAIMRAVSADIRHSIWQEVVDRVNAYEIEETVELADSKMKATCGKNSVKGHGFKKSSSARTAKLKSLAGYTDAFIEEAEEVGEDEFQQLDDSLRAEGSQIHMMLNTPSKNHWIVKRWFNCIPVDDAPGFYRLELKPEAAHEVEFIFSDHTKNPYMVEAVHKRYEAYRHSKPAYYWQMIRGLSPEVVMGRIYTGWREIEEVPHEAQLLCYILDFGFDPDPAALGALYRYNGGFIVDEIAYQTHLKNAQLGNIIRAQPEKAIVIADAAEPKSIAEIKEMGIDIMACEKGPDSVRHGIKKVQGLKISYTKRSKNIKREYENYRNKLDKNGDEVAVEDPACDNHFMSAIRYGFSWQLPDDPAKEFEQKLESANNQRERVSNAQQDAGL